jgi:membrane-associated phospholipid phosphatase
MIWFRHLEKTVVKHYDIIHMKLDNFIPFCEIFIIPYLLWFGYVAVVLLYLFFRQKDDFIKSCVFLFTGMTIFLIISTFWPNGHQLRPHVMPRDNIFTQLIGHLYKIDTSTNIWPSIHVYNSIGAHLAVIHCEKLKKHKVLTLSSLILCVSIVCSTVLIKQHSVFDVLTAFIMAIVMYMVVYHNEYSLVVKLQDNYRKPSQPRVS